MLFSHTIEEADRCGNMLASSRTRSGLSRKTIGNALDVSESTIKAWENGHGSPTLHGILEWFRIVGESPFRPMLDFFWPDVFAGLTEKNTDDEIREAGKFYFSSVAGPMEIQKLHYLIWGSHGSDWSGLLDMACAHTHTSLDNRYRVAEIIQASYEMSIATGHAQTPPEIEADRPLLLSAITAAKEACVAPAKSGYAIGLNHADTSALLARARIDSGATQKELAKALGKTLHTIQKWETNYNPPFLDLCTWFHVLNIPAWAYIRCLVYPTEKLAFPEGDKQRREEVIDHLSSASSAELRKLFYLITGMHGSNWMAVLEMMFEHVCSPLVQRVISARSILIGYQLDQCNQQLLKTNHIMPDIENLNRCIELGTEAVKKGLPVYKLS